MGLNKRIDTAVSAAVAAVMTAYTQERTGALLPPLSWSLDTDGLLVGHTGADYVEGEVGGVIARWAEVLGLTPAPVTAACAGSAVYSGTVEGRSVLVWGVTDRDSWERSCDPAIGALARRRLRGPGQGQS